MIDVPTPWKDALAKVAGRLEARAQQARWTDRTDYLIERDFVVGAYVMRKLIESNQVSEATSRRRIPVRSFDPSGGLPAASGEAYSLDYSRRDTLSVIELCDEILHNSAFTFCCGETGDLFDGIFVSSHRDGDEHVYLILASDYIALCDDIGAENLS